MFKKKLSKVKMVRLGSVAEHGRQFGKVSK